MPFVLVETIPLSHADLIVILGCEYMESARL